MNYKTGEFITNVEINEDAYAVELQHNDSGAVTALDWVSGDVLDALGVERTMTVFFA